MQRKIQFGGWRIVQPKGKFLSSYTPPHVIPNPHEFISSFIVAKSSKWLFASQYMINKSNCSILQNNGPIAYGYILDGGKQDK